MFNTRLIPPDNLELWGGHECTVNRVGDHWYDQTPWSGHEHRLGDLDLFASLGIRALRYPALWERIAPRRPEERDFSWTDERLPRIRQLGMRPIVTLCHHGSGPAYTNLLREDFATGLAAHARATAERYPWVHEWTPVNEPLTTARFSALYGYWYPHTTDEGAFWTALLNEIDATRLAMREIRRVNSRARLIQTDDLGYCHATTPLKGEAAYQNDRRWAGWDLLCGMVDRNHPLWARIVASGLEERLRRILDDPCPPDVIGVNHYLASERLLDHRVERHVTRDIADRGLGQHDGIPYVDVDAIRSRDDGVLGLRRILEQAWERYGRTIAITESHLGSSREEQARWFIEAWRTAEDLRAQGVNLCAVTAWSLLGSYDWNRMVMRPVGHYEVGVFDVRSGEPRPTVLARVLPDLAAGRPPASGVGLGRPGWWRREGRIAEWPVARAPSTAPDRPLLIAGPAGPLSRLMTAACRRRGLGFVRVATADAKVVAEASPWAVFASADWAGVCEQTSRPSLMDLEPPEDLATACADLGVPCGIVTASEGFTELDERMLSLGGDRLLLARTDHVFGPADKAAWIVRMLGRLELGVAVEADPTAPWTEVYGPDLVDGVLDLLMDGAAGLYPLVHPDDWSQAQALRRLVEIVDADPDLVHQRPSPAGAWAAPPARGAPAFLPHAEVMLERLVRENRAARRSAPSPRRAVEPDADEPIRAQQAQA